MINYDHWAWVEVGLDETPSLRINFNVLIFLCLGCLPRSCSIFIVQLDSLGKSKSFALALHPLWPILPLHPHRS